MLNKFEDIHRKLLKAKGQSCTRGSSRSSPKGKISCNCMECNGEMIIKMVDRFNYQSECKVCGLIENSGWQTNTQKGY